MDFHAGSLKLQYVLPGNSVQSREPSTLSVEKHPFENKPNHLIQGVNKVAIYSHVNKVISVNKGIVFDAVMDDFFSLFDV